MRKGLIIGGTLLIGMLLGMYMRPLLIEEPPRVEIKRLWLVEYPRLKVVAIIGRTQHQVGEEISVTPSLINIGEQPVTIFSGRPLLFVNVYDAENRRVFHLPPWRLPILVSHTLQPQTPNHVTYTFTLEQPGRYKIVAWAEFSFDEAYGYPLRIYDDPIWIEVVAGSNCQTELERTFGSAGVTPAVPVSGYNAGSVMRDLTPSP